MYEEIQIQILNIMTGIDQYWFKSIFQQVKKFEANFLIQKCVSGNRTKIPTSVHVQFAKVLTKILCE